MREDVAAQLLTLFPLLKQRYGQCERKAVYTDTRTVLAVKERRERETGLSLFVYRCEYAEHYHLSSHHPTPAQQVRLRAWVEDILTSAQTDALVKAERVQAVDREITRCQRELDTTGRVYGMPIPSRIRLMHARRRALIIQLHILFGERVDLWRDVVQLNIAGETMQTDDKATVEGYQRFMARLTVVDLEAQEDAETNDRVFQETMAREDRMYEEMLRDGIKGINTRSSLPAYDWRHHLRSEGSAP